MIVKLLSHTKDPEQVVAAAIRQCYASVGPRELKRKIDKDMREIDKTSDDLGSCLNLGTC